MKAENADFYDTLSERLDPRSGKAVQSAENDGEYWKSVLDIRWKGDIHFTVTKALFRRGLAVYCVMRDGQLLSPQYYAAKPDDTLLRAMQHIIDDIESGKYNNKKTLKEKIRELISERELVSYMNNTKWREFLGALREKAPDNCLQYKTVFEEEAPAEYRDIFSDEELEHMELSQIEWLKIKSTLTEYEHIGALLPPKVRTHDKKEELLQIMREYNIPYEYDEDEQTFIVYGYK